MVMTEEKRERTRIAHKRWRDKNKEKIKLIGKEYRENNKERESQRAKKYNSENKEKVLLYNKEYSQTPNGKKFNKLRKWKYRGLIASNEELDRIYNLWLTQELCNACDVKLTRTGKNSKTNATMDHCHETGRFRHVICNSCNIMDNWKKHFC